MRLRRLWMIALVSLVPSVASAAEQANAASVTGETGLFTLLSGDTLPRGGWSFGLYYNNWDRLLDVDLPDDQRSVDWNRLSASFGYGITDRWELSVMVPYEDYKFDVPGLDDESGVGQGQSTMSTSTRRSSRTAQALTTVRSALAVRPPRPMTLP